jgi:tetratricopeptide (TPR) repeat protein
MRFWQLFSVLFFSFCGTLLAGNPLPAGADPHCVAGFDALYNLDYEKAKKQFEEIIRKDSKHPAGYVYLASAVWLEHLSKLRGIQTQIYNRGNAFFRLREAPATPAVDKLFYTTIQKGLIRSKLRLQKDRTDLAGLYYLGSAHGTIAGYESTIKRSFLSSLQNGTEAVDAHKKLVKLYPSFNDAYVSIGMYNYVMGRLPAAMKILMLLGGVRGSKEEGLKQLERAADHGTLAKDEAAAVLVLLYDREKQHERALKRLQKLSEKYPANPVFRFETAAMLGKLGKFRESLAIYDSLLKEEQARNLLLDYIHFETAEILFGNGSWQKAYERFLTARRVKKDSPIGLITMSHLRAGQCLDAMGRNREAAIEYQFVMKQPEIMDSRKLAKKYLSHPFGAVIQSFGPR